MNKEEIQLLKENFLVEELEKLFFPTPLTKNAGLFESLGGASAANWLQTTIKEKTEQAEDTPGGKFTVLLDFLAPSVAFKINPFLGLFYLGLSALGYDISGIARSVAKILKPKIESGEPISPQEIKSAVDSSMGPPPSESGTDTSEINDNFATAEESFDFLIKQAYLIKNSYYKSTPPIVERIFGNLFKTGYGKRKLWDIGKGLIFWMFKNIFISLGMLAGVSLLVGSKFKKDESKPEESSPSETPSSSESKTDQESKEESSFFSKKKEPIENLYWIENLINGSVRQTLVSWALRYYPELNQYSDIDQKIFSDPNFKAVERKILSEPDKIGTRSMEMPQEYVTSRNVKELEKKVVDKFITSEFLRKLNATKTQ